MTPTERRQAITTLIASTLEVERARRGLTQAGLAVHAHLSKRTVWAIFNGHDHYVSTLADLADALGCELVIEMRARPESQHLTVVTDRE